jgi:hypothetical protein
MESSISMMVVEYSKTTKNVCICLSIAVMLIILFMISPLKNFMMTSLIGKMVILVLLGYIMYYNTTQTNMFSQKFDMSLFSGDWNPVKTNILCGYLFTLFIFILAMNVLRKMF